MNVRGSVLAPAWFSWLCGAAAALNAIAVVTSMTFSSYHGAAWSIPGWGAFIGLVVVVLVASTVMLRTPVIVLADSEIAVPART